MKKSLVSSILLFSIFLILTAPCQSEILFPTTPDREILGLCPGGIAWGDIDNNGWLDLVVGEGTDFTFGLDALYYNFNGNLSLTPGWTSEYNGASCMTLLGDLDKDGDLDMVVPSLGLYGSFTPQDQVIYYNNGGSFPVNPDWHSEPMNAYCGALGDPDGDGDLDIVFADGGGSFYTKTIKMYYNNEGVFNTEPDWESDDLHNTIDASFVDIDLDGDLDLAICCFEPLIHVFYNHDGVLETTPSWSSSTMTGINGFPYMAFGDVDGDGYPDLAAAGGVNGGYLLFKNNSGTLESTPSWTCNAYIASSVAWADADDDGDLDLAGCGWQNAPIGIFENVDGVLSSTFAWSDVVGCYSFRVAWADYDEDMLVETTRNITADGSRKLFTLDEIPIHEISSIEVDGVPLDISQYCYDRESGWISMASPPEEASDISIYYTYSRDNDLAVGGEIAHIYDNKLSTLYFPTYSFTSTEFIDDNEDGFHESGETVRFYFSLENEHVTGNNVTVTMTCSNPEVVFTTASVFFSTVEGDGGSVNNSTSPIEYKVPDLEAAEYDTFFINIESDLGPYREQFQFIQEVGQTEILLIDDDGGESCEETFYGDFYGRNTPTHIWNNAVSGSPTASELSKYRIVFWFTGGNKTDCLQTDEIAAMKDYLDGGGYLFLSGLGLAGELSTDDPDFLQNYLHCSYSQDRSYNIHYGIPGSIFDGMQIRLATSQTVPGMEKILMESGGQQALKFSNTSTSYSAVTFADYYRMVFFTWGYELISSSFTGEGYASREEVLQRILDFFPSFICGDADGEGLINILDIVYLINALYKNGPAPDPMISADVNGDGNVNILDIVYLINYLYKNGPEPDCP